MSGLWGSRALRSKGHPCGPSRLFSFLLPLAVFVHPASGLCVPGSGPRPAFRLAGFPSPGSPEAGHHRPVNRFSLSKIVSRPRPGAAGKTLEGLSAFACSRSFSFHLTNNIYLIRPKVKRYFRDNEESLKIFQLESRLGPLAVPWLGFKALVRPRVPVPGRPRLGPPGAFSGVI